MTRVKIVNPSARTCPLSLSSPAGPQELEHQLSSSHRHVFDVRKGKQQKKVL
jgi:hypothetical protein